MGNEKGGVHIERGVRLSLDGNFPIGLIHFQKNARVRIRSRSDYMTAVRVSVVRRFLRPNVAAHANLHPSPRRRGIMDFARAITTRKRMGRVCSTGEGEEESEREALGEE